MKVKIEIDCTPAEARAFLGLPDFGPLQDRLIKELEARARTTLARMDPETLLKGLLPLGVQLGTQGLEQIQNLFSSIATGRPGATGRPDAPGSGSGAGSGAGSGRRTPGKNDAKG